MASIRRFKESSYWYAVYRDASGNQCNRSTKIKIAGEGDTEKDRGRDAAERRKLAGVIARTYEEQARGHSTEQHIQKVLLDIFSKVNKRRIQPAVIETFFTAWLGKVMTRRGEGKTLARYKVVTDRFIESLGPRRSAPLADILPQEIQAFIDAQLAHGKAATTIRIEHKILNAVFTDALKQGFIANNPAAAIAVPMDAGETRRPFDWPQVRTLINAASAEWKTAIQIAVFTGARLGDCCNLRWKNLDLPNRLIRYRPSKTKAKKVELVVPMHPDLEAHLLTLPASDLPDADELPLTPGLKTLNIGGRSGLSRQFAEIIVAAGIENIQIKRADGKGRALSVYSFHSLRHTFNSVLMNQGVGEDIRMRLSGHASEEMNRRYSHAEVETLRAAVSKIPTIRA